MQAKLLELTGIWHFKQATVTYKPTMGKWQHLQGRKKSTGTNTSEVIRTPVHEVINNRSHLFPWAEFKECEAKGWLIYSFFVFCMKGYVTWLTVKGNNDPTISRYADTHKCCLCCAPQTVRHASVSHIIMLGDMFFHCHKHSHRSLFYVDPTYTVTQ